MSDAEIGYDVVVVGSGAAGFAAAITARLRGLTALIVEKTDHYGGSTALSGGAIWVPGNFHLDAAGLGDTYEKARAYLDATVGDRVPGDRKDAYLRHGPRMVREFHDRTAVRFMYTPGYSDYFPEALGGMAQGRSAEPCVVDLKELGPLARDLRRAGLPTYGLTMTSYDFRFLNMVARTWAGRRRSLRVGARAVGAALRGRKLLSLGEALIARMRLSLERLGGDLWLSAPLTGLVVEGGRVTGVRVLRDGTEHVVRARGGVVLASGGFSHDQALRDKYLPQPTSTAWTHSSEGQVGDALRLGEELGAATDLLDKVWGAPSVCPPGEKPFFLVADRGIPGMVIVNAAGERYANEAAPYHEFVDRMYAADRPDATTVPSWLILDARSKARYIFAGLFPGQAFPKRWRESGFLKEAATVEELARIIEAPRLPSAIRRFNGFAATGKDEDFARGDSVYDRYYGDPTLQNPNLAPSTRDPSTPSPSTPATSAPRAASSRTATPASCARTAPPSPGSTPPGTARRPSWGRRTRDPAPRSVPPWRSAGPPSTTSRDGPLQTGPDPRVGDMADRVPRRVVRVPAGRLAGEDPRERLDGPRIVAQRQAAGRLRRGVRDRVAEERGQRVAHLRRVRRGRGERRRGPVAHIAVHVAGQRDQRRDALAVTGRHQTRQGHRHRAAHLRLRTPRVQQDLRQRRRIPETAERDDGRAQTGGVAGRAGQGTQQRERPGRVPAPRPQLPEHIRPEGPPQRLTARTPRGRREERLLVATRPEHGHRPVQSSSSGSPRRRARSASSAAGVTTPRSASRSVAIAACPVCRSLPDRGRPSSSSSSTTTVTPPSSTKRCVTASLPGRSSPARSTAATSAPHQASASASASVRPCAPCSSNARTHPVDPRRAAATSGRPPPGPGNRGSAPPSSSARTTCSCPRWSAHAIAVNPNSSRRSTRAPAASSARTTSVCPPHAAPHNGRSVPPLSRSGSAPADNSSRTMPGSSLTDAR